MKGQRFASKVEKLGVGGRPFMRFGLPNHFVFEELEVVEFAYVDEDDCDLIIGMDIMTQGDLAITNFEGKTVFSFRIPALHRVDFEAEHAV